jgi:hypothetical protein
LKIQDIETLIEAFKALGVEEPEAWAGSELKDGIFQLARATLLVEMASSVEVGTQSVLDYDQHEFPSARVPTILNKIKAADVTDDDLLVLLRFASSLVVFDLCALFDGSSEVRNNPGQLAFGLAVAHDDPMSDECDLQPTDMGLHESWGTLVAEKLGKDVYWY